jgi:hypothetical protein
MRASVPRGSVSPRGFSTGPPSLHGPPMLARAAMLGAGSSRRPGRGALLTCRVGTTRCHIGSPHKRANSDVYRTRSPSALSVRLRSAHPRTWPRPRCWKGRRAVPAMRTTGPPGKRLTRAPSEPQCARLRLPDAGGLLGHKGRGPTGSKFGAALVPIFATSSFGHRCVTDTAVRRRRGTTHA